MEIVLVMVIMVIVAAVGIPLVSSMFAVHSLEAAQDTVQAQLKKAQNKAKEEGRAYKFAVKANTGVFRIAPDGDEFWSGSSAGTDGTGPEATVIEGNLPEKVCFSQPQGVGNSGGSGDWSTIATFLADGSALEDVQVGITSDGSRPLVINVKAATGSVTAPAAAVPGAQ